MVACMVTQMLQPLALSYTESDGTVTITNVYNNFIAISDCHAVVNEMFGSNFTSHMPGLR